MRKIGIIGGIIAEIEGHPYGEPVKYELNEGTISMAYGGVGRNIAENLARMGEKVLFSSFVGDDFSGRGAVRELEDLGVDAKDVKLLGDKNTAAYMSVLNLVGDLEMSISNMDVLEHFSKEMIDETWEHFKDCAMIGLDGSLSKESLKYILEKSDDIPLFLDPASTVKAERIKDMIGKFHTIKPNRREAETITGLSILSSEEMEAAGDWFIKKGVKRVFMTLGGGGVYYTDGKEKGTIRPVMEKGKPVKKIVSEIGAGDAFSAAVISGFARGFDMKTTAEYGMSAAALAMSSQGTVNQKLTDKVLEDTYNELFGYTKN